MDIDWGVVATVTIIAKGVWDIYKERHKLSLDLSSLDTNVAQAANISIKTVLESLKHVQGEVEILKQSNKVMRQDIQTMGRSLGQLRQEREWYRGLTNSLLGLVITMLARLRELSQPVEEENRLYEELKKEADQAANWM